MAGGLPRTNSAMRLEVKSWVTTTCDWLALNFATRLLKYGTTSGLVSSNTILVLAPAEDEEHPATRPGAAIAAAPSPTAFIIDRRLSTGPSRRPPRPPRAPEGSGTPEPPEALGAAVRWFRPDRRSLSCRTRDSPIPGPPQSGRQRADVRPGDGGTGSARFVSDRRNVWKRFHESRPAR